ncbi:MAG: sugar transferase [Lachnospiraceae bacterium]|nr:sugar transferase [Lachnospiraceae bacterium]
MGKFNRDVSTNLLHVVCDCCLMVVAFLMATLIAGLSLYEALELYGPLCVVFMVIFIMVNKNARTYNVTTFFYVDRTIFTITKSFIVSLLPVAVMAIDYLLNHSYELRFLCTYVIAAYVLIIVGAFFIRFLATHWKFNAPRVLLVGDIDRFGTFKKYLYKSNTSVRLVGYVSMEDTTDERYLGSVKDLEKIVHENAIGQVYIMNRKSDMVDIQQYIDICLDMGVSVRIIVKLFQAHGAHRYVSSVGTYPVVTYHRVCLDDSSKALKRIIDIIGSLIGIIVFSPFMLIAAIAIKLDSKGPVIFKQKRAGINGSIFEMYKFRSMCVDAEELKAKLQEQNEVKDGLMFKIKDDPRITKVGKFIRKTSIDELPQFFNVLFGSMSLVGTRPPTLDEVEKYERTHWRRMSIKPGITGMWQVSGRSQITDFEKIVELDTEYIDNWSIWLDFKIMLKTVTSLLQRKGAY